MTFSLRGSLLRLWALRLGTVRGSDTTLMVNYKQRLWLRPQSLLWPELGGASVSALQATSPRLTNLVNPLSVLDSATLAILLLAGSLITCIPAVGGCVTPD